MIDWVLTLPRTVEWEEYQKELTVVKSGVQVMNYRLPYRPKAQAGDRCFLCWRGKVRGWMRVTGVMVINKGGYFSCTTSGAIWGSGHYLQRSGKFYVVDGPVMKGFRGLRRMPTKKERYEY